MSAAGNFSNVRLEVPGTIDNITVAEAVTSNGSASISNEFAAGYRSSATIGNLTVGQWSGVDLTSFSIGTFTAKGNSAAAMPGTVTGSAFDVFGGIANVGLSSFSASGAVTGSTFNITDGNVNSFVVSRFLNSNLFLGVIVPTLGDITATTTTADWLATFILFKFVTTGAFSSNDINDTASFANSDIVSGKLGTVSLSGVNPTLDPLTSTAFTFGVAYRAPAETRGTVTIGNIAGVLPSPFTPLGDFNYIGLPG